METVHLCLDVGGTEIKAAALNNSGRLVTPLLHFDAMAQDEKAQILGNFQRIFRMLYDASENSPTVASVNLAFPGDFDYPKGVCLMKGIGKYEALYGVNLREEFGRIFQEDETLSCLTGRPISFCNDVEAVAWGENSRKELADCKRTLCVCIGTGCGSAFFQNGRPAPPGTLGMPEKGWIYCLPYKDSILDDYLSKRGLERISQEITGLSLDGKSLAELCETGDERAKQCFIRFGEQLVDGLSTVLTKFHPDALILGGQLMKSRSRFCGPLEEFCRSLDIQIHYSPDTSKSALRGLWNSSGLRKH